MRSTSIFVLAMTLFLFFTACVTQKQLPALSNPTALATIPESLKSIKNVVLIVLENTSKQAALKTTFLSTLTNKGALLNQYFAITHPSQPNYIALIAGDTFGVIDDENVSINAKHLGQLLEENHLKWKSYAEGYPGNCTLERQIGAYVRKHEPFITFMDVQNNSNSCKQIVPATEFDRDFQAGTLPEFSLYIPDLNNDAHDTGIDFASQYLAKRFGPIFDDPKTQAGVLFIITFDEDDYSDNNRVLTLFYGTGVQAGATSQKQYNHYSLLATIEKIFGLPDLGRNDAKASIIDDIWQKNPSLVNAQ